LERFRVNHRVIGEGSLKVVMQAIDEYTGKEVVIKFTKNGRII